ncbi:MAG TPA: branched-chain amino acid ABC transporter permease [Candidatus Binatia bacterium]|nr:branched-chain amino acid ABC transporter permease [Candidatus Binatia bacterium]
MPRAAAWLVGIGVFVTAGLTLSDYALYLVNLIATTAILALGLTIVTGVAGQVSLAQAAFAGIGGYGAVLLATGVGLPLWLGIPLAALGAAAVGYLLGLPALRLEGPYLALVTLGFTAIVQTILIHWQSVTNGPLGLPVPPLTVAGRPLTSGRDLYLVVVPVAVLIFIAARRLLRSRVGRALDALRQSEVAATVLGVNPVHYKTLAFALSAFLGGIGGGLHALLTTFLSPETFGIIESIFFLVVIVVGGVGQVAGAVVGAALLVLLPETLGGFKHYQALVYGVLLLAFIVFVPGGLSGLATRLAWRS